MQACFVSAQLVTPTWPTDDLMSLGLGVTLTALCMFIVASAPDNTRSTKSLAEYSSVDAPTTTACVTRPCFLLVHLLCMYMVCCCRFVGKSWNLPLLKE